MWKRGTLLVLGLGFALFLALDRVGTASPAVAGLAKIPQHPQPGNSVARGWYFHGCYPTRCEAEAECNRLCPCWVCKIECERGRFCVYKRRKQHSTNTSMSVFPMEQHEVP